MKKEGGGEGKWDDFVGDVKEEELPANFLQGRTAEM